MIKLMFCLRRLPALDRATFQAYWRDKHAPLAAAELLADERNFIDLSASPLFLVAEHVVLPAGATLQQLAGSPFQP